MPDDAQRPLPNLPELRLLHPPSVRLPPNIRVPLPREVANLIDLPLFQRLREVRQLGFVDRVYPGATHTRFEHSIGVYHQTINYVHTLWEDPHNDFFRNTMRKQEIRALLVAALCHDLGQYPLAHVLEDSERQSDGTFRTRVFDHESLTFRLLSDHEFRHRVGLESASDSTAPRLEDTLAALGITYHDVLSVLTGQNISDNLVADAIPVLHSILDGPIDADKLDYLRRDGHHAGVDFVNIDEDRFYQSLTIVPSELSGPANGRQIALTNKGRVPAEQILIARFHMFTEVYWHAVVRAHEAVLAAVVQRVRSLVDGFDEWFSVFVLHPEIKEDWYTQLIPIVNGSILKIRDPSNPRLSDIQKKCKQMIQSLVTYRDGRNQYSVLLEVASTDQGFYHALQKVREVSLRFGEPYLDTLASVFCNRLNEQLSYPVDPLDVIVDIPPIRAAASDVLIIEPDPRKRRDHYTLSDRWPMWREFVTYFHERTRLIRVFVPRSVAKDLIDRVERNDQIIYNALKYAALKVVQMVVRDLPLFASAGSE